MLQGSILAGRCLQSVDGVHHGLAQRSAGAPASRAVERHRPAAAMAFNAEPCLARSPAWPGDAGRRSDGGHRRWSSGSGCRPG
jgi:hypothetical protein